MDSKAKLITLLLTLIVLLCSTIGTTFAAENRTVAADSKRAAASRAEKVRYHSEYNTAEVVSGNFTTARGASRLEKAYDFIGKRQQTFKMARPQEELNLLFEKTDNLGRTHLRFQQLYKNLTVWGCQTIVHFDKDEAIYLVGGQTIATPNLNTVPTITESEAAESALAEVGNRVDTPDLEAKSELVVYPFENETKLVRLVTVTSPTNGSIRWLVFVDAQTGDVIDQFNDIHFDGPDVGEGPDVLDVYQTFPIYLQSGDYIMWDVTRNAEIYTFEDYYNGGPVSTDPDGDKIWDDNTDQKAAVSGHYYTGLTVDYFWTTFGRNSYDGLGSVVIVNVHDPVYVNNAYWNGASINFADGDGTNYLPFSGSLDVVAHEFGHGVTQHTAGLIYRFQSGALNESYSDVFGASVDNDDWLLGEDIRLSSPGFIRSMEDPTLRGHPAHMDDYGWLDIEVDNGGVHSNSGIPNHAFYWAASLTSRAVAEQVWYRTLTTYLTPSSGMYFWSAMILQSAVDLYGGGSSEYDNIALALSIVGFNGTYATPEDVTLSNIVGTVSTDTIWVHNPNSDAVTLSSSPPTLGNLSISAPGSVSGNDSGAVELTYDTQGMGECDIGLYSDLLEIITDGPSYSSTIYIPVDVFVGYTTTSLETLDINTACLSFRSRNTSGFDKLSKSDNDAVYDGSLLIGINDGGTKTTYRDVFGTLSLIPVDTVKTDSAGKSFRIASADGRIQGSVQYRWYAGADPDTCDFIIADYTLENVCETTLTVWPGLFCDFDINNSGSNIASYDAANNLVYVKDNSSDRLVGFAMLTGPAYNMRSIHNPDLVWGGNFTDNAAYGELTASSNREGLSPSDYSALLSFGSALLTEDVPQTFSAVMVYSTGGLSGLQSSLALARAFDAGIVILYGDANSDGSVNVADAVYIINYVFKGGPAPDPLENGDANCDGDVNVGDAVYIINYVFKGGPEPGCP
jgi:Zn-dependent metalloprotease